MGACHSQEREPWETAHKTEPSCQAWRLVDRVAAARSARQANRSTIPLPLAPGSHVSAHMVVCPHAARATFAEDCDALSKSRGRCAALTAVNGDAWRAQRPLVAKALGARRRAPRRAAAVAVAADLMARLRGTVDAREVGLRVGAVRCRGDGGLRDAALDAPSRRFSRVARAGALPSDAR